MLHRSPPSVWKVLRLLHKGALSEPQNGDRSVDVSVVMRPTFRACPLPNGNLFNFSPD